MLHREAQSRSMLHGEAQSTGWPMERRASLEGGCGGATFLGCRSSRLRPEAASLGHETCDLSRYEPPQRKMAV
jgi:hypothetical protein